MNQQTLLTQISEKQIPKEDLAKEVIAQSELLPVLFEGLGEKKADIKYGCAKILMILSEEAPVLLYPQFDFFITLLDSEKNVFRWNAINILAHLTKVDAENKFDPIWEKYFAPISGPELITAGNIVGAAAEIAVNKPEWTDRITEQLLKVETGTYDTDECKNIMFGHVITAFSRFFKQIENKKPVIELVKKQLENSRGGTVKKAEKFLKKYKIE